MPCGLTPVKVFEKMHWLVRLVFLYSIFSFYCLKAAYFSTADFESAELQKSTKINTLGPDTKVLRACSVFILL